MTEKVLFVDDDPNLLASCERSFRRLFNVETAAGAEAALETIAAHSPFAVVVSDRHMPGMDGITFLTKVKERSPDTVRLMLTGNADLEGAINRLLAHSKLNAQPVTLEMAEREVRDLIRPQEPKRIKIEDIQRVVARQYNVSRSDLLSSRRTANVVRPRQVAMYLAKTLTLRSLPEIGRRFGGRDHTTVLHAVRKIEALVAKDTALSEEVESLKRQLQE